MVNGGSEFIFDSFLILHALFLHLVLNIKLARSLTHLLLESGTSNTPVLSQSKEIRMSKFFLSS